MDDIYALPLHERGVADSNLTMIRVPGGWIYEIWDEDNKIAAAVFVPFNNEFQVKDGSDFFSAESE